MTTFKKIIIEIFGAAVIGIVVVMLLRGCHPKLAYQPPTPDSTRYYKDAASHLTAFIRGQAADFAKIRQSDIDSVAKSFNTKPAEIREIIRWKTRTNDTLRIHDTARVVRGDSGIIAFTQSFSDGWFNAEVHLNAVHPDSSRVAITGIDSITLVSHEVHSGSLFNRRTFMQLDIRNANPNITQIGAQQYNRPVKQPGRFALGALAGYGASDAGLHPFIGLGITYDLIRFP